MSRTGTSINTNQKDISKGRRRQGNTSLKNKAVAMENTSLKLKNSTLKRQLTKHKHSRMQLGVSKLKKCTQACRACRARNSFY